MSNVEDVVVVGLRQQLAQAHVELALLQRDVARHIKSMAYLKPLLDGLCEAQLAGDIGTVLNIVEGMAKNVPGQPGIAQRSQRHNPMTDLNHSETMTIPDGFVQNAAGHLVPEHQVREHDKLRDHVAAELALLALGLSKGLAAFKTKALADIDDLISISHERYGVKIGGKKGNASITTFDGKFKIERAMAERIKFTEEILAAKELIDQCIRKWSEGADQHLRVLVDRAFRANRQGQIKTGDVLSLLRVEIDDPDWKMAMEALKDSIQVNGTSVYIRVYQRVGATDRYEPINLNVAVV